MTSITVASVVTATILFTVFPKDYKSSIFGFDPRKNSVRGESDDKVDRFDHRSHSVPGGIYEAIDYEGKGEVYVKLDGSRSHTHYVEEGPPLVNGNIVNYVWFDNKTHVVLGTGVDPKIPFRRGITVLGLTVADNTRDTQTDFTKVIIRSPIIPGIYCYFYYTRDRVTDDIAQGPRPENAKEYKSIDFKALADFPFAASATRCVFQAYVRKGTTFKFSQTGWLKFILEKITRDNTREKYTLIDSGDPNLSATYTGESAMLYAQVIYTRRGNKPQLRLTASVGKVYYDVSKSVPVILGMDPDESTPVDGGKMKITGISLGNIYGVFFGEKKAEFDKSPVEKDGTSVFVKVPKFPDGSSVRVTVRNKNGKSNELSFRFSTSGTEPIRFTKVTLKNGDDDFKIDQITGIKYGPDHRYHVTTYSSRIHSFGISRAMKVVGKVCTTGVLGPNRIALGLAFNYASQRPRLYVSSSVLYWRKNGYLSGPFAWANGQIHVLEQAGQGPCLKEAKNSPIITGLPVSNYDHGVNGLVFDDDGNLHIQVGGSTNAGHNHADSALGGIDESPLSGASLIAYVNKQPFDGRVQYSSSDPGTAKQTAGFDVQVFMSGWRNSFGINLHSNKNLYATDNGASRPFGEMSITCNTHGALPGSADLKDKLGKVKRDRYFGHPNRNRGRTDPKQCKFLGEKAGSNGHYLPPVTTLESSTNGIVEYTANTFDGQMKGDLLLSKYAADKSPGKIFRLQLKPDGEKKDDVELFWEVSGLSIETSPYGDIISPQIWKGLIVVLKPDTATKTTPEFRAVMPPRGSFRGGNIVIVTGSNFGPNPHAKFGNEKCTKVHDVTETSFKCTVPAGEKGTHVKVSIVPFGREPVESKQGPDYKYMNI